LIAVSLAKHLIEVLDDPFVTLHSRSPFGVLAAGCAACGGASLALAGHDAIAADGRRSVVACALASGRVGAAFGEDAARAVRAAAAVARDTERRLQLGERPDTERNGVTNLSIGYSIANADVHRKLRE
jgi:hypothetical protein